jgi:hypothetical protein
MALGSPKTATASATEFNFETSRFAGGINGGEARVGGVHTALQLTTRLDGFEGLAIASGCFGGGGCVGAQAATRTARVTSTNKILRIFSLSY